MKFNPTITKIKLNPEQAVLTCTCVLGRYVRTTNRSTRTSLCTSRSNTSRNTRSTQYCQSGTQNNTT